MARTFVSASSQKAEIASAVLSAMPLTMHCWWNAVSAAVFSHIFSISDGSTSNSFSLEQTSAGNARAKTEAAATNTFAVSSTALVAATWNSICAVFASATDRRAFLNGGGKGTDAVNKTPGGLNTTTIGGGGGLFANGNAAECAIWNIALADAEVALLAAGIAPWLVHPEALVAYWPLLHGYSPEIDLIKGNNLIVTGAALTAHPPLRYRSAR